MNIFPIGLVAAASDQGTLNSISYDMFEPNDGCNSTYQFDILTTMFQNKMMLTRKKSERVLTVEYRYNNILEREYRQIEHFLSEMDESLTSFWLVDFSQGQTPTGIVESASDWIVSLDSTIRYSTTTNYKANRAFIKYGSSWKEGSVVGISTNTSVTVDVDTSNYGNLSITNANLYAMIYPMYEVYAMQNSLSNLKTTVYVSKDISLNQNGGWMRSGNISFVGKYKV
jgi:hypothetical protein